MIRYTFIALVVACAGPVTQPDVSPIDAGLTDSAVCTEVRTICVREQGATDDVCASEIETVVVVPCQS